MPKSSLSPNVEETTLPNWPLLLTTTASSGCIDHKMWVSDLNGEFLGGKRELPDGFSVELTAARQ
jgi:hypothetical protein